MGIIMGIMILAMLAFVCLFIAAVFNDPDELSEEAEEMKSDLDVELAWHKILSTHYPGKVNFGKSELKEVDDMPPDQWFEKVQKLFRGPIQWEKEGTRYHIEYDCDKIKYFIDSKEV